MPTNGFSIKPLKVKLLAGEQKATEILIQRPNARSPFHPLPIPRCSRAAAGALRGVLRLGAETHQPGRPGARENPRNRISNGLEKLMCRLIHSWMILVIFIVFTRSPS